MKTKHLTCIAVGALVAALTPVTPAHASTDPFIGEIKAVGFNFCPRGWAPADGRLLPISENTALFALLGTMYGGDGRTKFALPDLTGRSPMGAETQTMQRRSRTVTQSRVGEKRGGTSSIEGEDVPSAKQLAVTYCVALVGIFPSRN